MGFKCKMVEKSTNPRDKSAPKKWYGTTQSETPLSGKAMTKAAAENTTLAPIELEAALDLLANFIPQQLLQGHTVTLPEGDDLRHPPGVRALQGAARPHSPEHRV